FILLSGCKPGQSTPQSTGASKTENMGKYGYSKSNPIKVGGGSNGPVNERRYLNSLTGPNGEQVSFHRQGSCCTFETPNSPYGGGALDIYRVYYTGIKDTAVLYLNMYDKDVLRAPEGFLMRAAR